MDSLLLGLAAPAIASTAGAVGRAVTAVAKPLTSHFASFLQAETQTLLWQSQSKGTPED